MMYLNPILLPRSVVILTILISSCAASDGQCIGYYTNRTDHHHQSQLGVRTIIDCSQSLSIVMNTNQSNCYSYSTEFMKSLSHPDDHDCKLSNETCIELAFLRLLRSPCTEHPNYLSRRILKSKCWRHRGRQAGLRHLRREDQIPVIISNSRSNYTFAKLNESNLNDSELIRPCTNKNTSVNAPSRRLVTPHINREPLMNFRLWNPRSIRKKKPQH